MTPLQELLRQAVAINSISPTLVDGPGEAEIAAWAAQRLRDMGADVQVQEAAPERPNVIARVPGRNAAPSLLLNAHLDTVGVEGMEAPFTLRAEGDHLFGRGAYDMKGSIAVMLSLAEHFTDNPPPGDLWFTLVSDEEALSVGMEALVREWLPTLPTKPVAAIVLEPSEEEVGIAHKGFVWYEITVQGRAAHGSWPDKGVDAIVPLGAALNELVALERGFLNGPTHPLLGRPSLHASMIQGGTAWSVYPAEASLQWERRTLPTEPDGQGDQELERVVAAADAVNDAQVVGRNLFQRYPLRTEPDAAIVRALQSAAPSASLTGLSFWTDGALLGAAGIPTVIYGPVGAGAHAVEEWVSLSSLERVSDVVRQVVEAAGEWAT